MPLSIQEYKWILKEFQFPLLLCVSDRQGFQVGSLSHMINLKASGYQELPQFPELAPDASVRNVEVSPDNSNLITRDYFVQVPFSGRSTCAQNGEERSGYVTFAASTWRCTIKGKLPKKDRLHFVNHQCCQLSDRNWQLTVYSLIDSWLDSWFNWKQRAAVFYQVLKTW